MGLFDIFDKLVKGRGQQLSWGWVPDGNLVPAAGAAPINTAPFAAGQNYFVIRLSEMYLHDTRVLWKKYYPMVQAYVDHGDQHATAVAGPGQLKDLGSVNLDRLIGLAYPLCPVTVYRGVDLTFLVGLYSVESQDVAKVLLSSLGQLSTLAGLGADLALKVADVVKTGIEGVLNLGGTTLQLGARDALTPGTGVGKQARAGCLVAINAPAGSVDCTTLWVKDGRLLKGSNPISASNYSDHDYMLIEIERRETREDWASLAEIQQHEPDIDKALRSGGKAEDIKTQLNAIWTALMLDIQDSTSLTDPDKTRVLASLQADLQAKLDRLKQGGPFELKSVAPAAARLRPDAVFDLLAVADVFAGKSQAQIDAISKQALSPLQ